VAVTDVLTGLLRQTKMQVRQEDRYRSIGRTVKAIIQVSHPPCAHYDPFSSVVLRAFNEAIRSRKALLLVHNVNR
jgi:hypothetical protein